MNTAQPLLSFAESIELGKYDQEYLSQYQEWRELDRQLKFQFISKAIKKRRLQLRLQWANLANQPNFSKKPHLLDAQKKVEQALVDLDKDEEVLMVEYAGC
ncbi:hypothetical protein KBC79_06875 [Candidatus Woesebacteria bacterium]|nr:hypothetical protein [Candidatus Woesebacteria bacterium]